MTDAIKHLASDPGTDPKVKKKLASVLLGWKRQFQDDPSMASVAKLYDQCKIAHNDRTSADRRAIDNVHASLGLDAEYMERKRKEEEARKKKEDEKRKAKEDKERRKREEEERRRKAAQPKTKRKPFNFEQVCSTPTEARVPCPDPIVGEASNPDCHCQCFSSRK